MIDIGQVLGTDTVIDIMDKITIHNLQETYKTAEETISRADLSKHYAQEDIDSSLELMEGIKTVLKYCMPHSEYQKWWEGVTDDT